jgi:hypothetical protein
MTLPDRLRAHAFIHAGLSGMDTEQQLAFAADLRAAADALEAAGWRPIETAPQDGTMVLYWSSTNRSGCFVGNQPPGCHRGLWYCIKDEWRGGADFRAYDAEYWMPLPPPPT